MAQASIGAGKAEIIENLGFATSLVFLILPVILSLIILICGLGAGRGLKRRTVTYRQGIGIVNGI